MSRGYTKAQVELGLDASQVFDRMRDAIGAVSDADLARFLGLSRQSLWNRRNAEALPFKEAVYVALTRNVSLDWLILGRPS